MILESKAEDAVMRKGCDEMASDVGDKGRRRRLRLLQYLGFVFILNNLLLMLLYHVSTVIRDHQKAITPIRVDHIII